MTWDYTFGGYDGIFSLYYVAIRDNMGTFIEQRRARIYSTDDESKIIERLANALGLDVSDYSMVTIPIEEEMPKKDVTNPNSKYLLSYVDFKDYIMQDVESLSTYDFDGFTLGKYLKGVRKTSTIITAVFENGIIVFYLNHFFSRGRYFFQGHELFTVENDTKKHFSLILRSAKKFTKCCVNYLCEPSKFYYIGK